MSVHQVINGVRDDEEQVRGFYALIAYRPAWHAQAACRGMGPAGWFPDQRTGPIRNEIMALCAGCPVRADCAAAGLREQHGLWGGLTVAQRRQLRRETGIVLSRRPKRTVA